MSCDIFMGIISFGLKFTKKIKLHLVYVFMWEILANQFQPNNNKYK